MMEEFRELAEGAKAVGLAVVLWSYPRGGNLSKDGETAIDVTAYAAHLAALLGAHIIKVKPPTAKVEQKEAADALKQANVDTSSLSKRIEHVMQAAFKGRRLVVFSGGSAKGTDAVLDEVREIAKGGSNGSIIGRNSFQREKGDALALLDSIVKIYQGKA